MQVKQCLTLLGLLNRKVYDRMEIQKRKQVGILTLSERIERKHQEDLQRLRGFRLLDDDFLTKCFEGNTESIELVLQIVMEKPDLKVLDVRTQVFVENILNRSVRLDIVATDSTGTKINVEIQRADKGAGKKRARYNSSMMDACFLEKGTDFEGLPETWVIFITENDIMGKDRPLYRIERCFLETNEKFEDGSHILYVNGAYRSDTPIGKLMHDFSCTDASDMYYKTLADRVRFFKESKEGMMIMCKVMEDMREESLREGMREGMKEGMKEGIKEGAVSAAKKMLADGTIALEKIAEFVGLSVDEIKKIKENQAM